MVQTLKTTSSPDVDVDDVARLITPDGTRISDPALDRWAQDVDDATLHALYRDMVIVRRMDAEGVALQRQGQVGLWPPCEGQEAVQVGTARALAAQDVVFPSYRELGVLHVRGIAGADLVGAWRGEEHSMWDPHEKNVATPQIIIGAQTLHAVGCAMGMQRDEDEAVAIAYFGDGATSQGDVNEAMIFAASFGAPAVFVCSNNQFAISEPVRVQSRQPIAQRAPGYGIPSLRIDGNDALASFAAMRWALDHARSGEGPAFIEAVTYRMGPHTTADDPKRYRDADELERWRKKDPILRLERYLRQKGVLDDEAVTRVAADADQSAAEIRRACLEWRTRDPLTVFDNVYAEPHSSLQAQRDRYGAYLAGFADEEAAR